MTGVHPRVSVNSVSSLRWELAEELDLWSRIGVRHAGISLAELRPDLAAGVGAVRSRGIGITTILLGRAFQLGAPDTIDAGRERLITEIDELRDQRIDAAYLTTGPSQRGMTLEASLDAFCDAIGPVVDHARNAGVALAVEHNSTMTHDTGCIHSVADALAVAGATGLGVVVELQNCWLESGLAASFGGGVDHLDLVQVSDFVVGTDVRLSRACPGDGDVPIEHLLQLLLDAGYGGLFDLELLGPDIEAEGYEPAITRSVGWLSACLQRLGA